MIDPTMRGWGILATGRGMPDPLLPIGPEQDAETIGQQRRESAEKLEANWKVKEGELHFKSAADTSTYDPPSQIQYIRPLLDGESVEFSVWPTGVIRRVQDLYLTENGLQDARLDLVDLRGILRKVTLRALDSRGQPLDEIRLSGKNVLGTGTWRRDPVVLKEGNVDLVLPTALQHLEVSARGHQPTSVSLSASPITARLKAR